MLAHAVHELHDGPRLRRLAPDVVDVHAVRVGEPLHALILAERRAPTRESSPTVAKHARNAAVHDDSGRVERGQASRVIFTVTNISDAPGLAYTPRSGATSW
ncbi:hypothetical protein GCM10025877_18670 [Agromyces mangrovi Wang et al. 2018]|nr:hypothetical protein GCM10025877_18670 [Agromyces mangrovi]